MGVEIIPLGGTYRAYCKECDKYVSDSTEEIQYAHTRALIHQATRHTEHSNMGPADSQG
jgi:ribosomal protein L44E